MKLDEKKIIEYLEKNQQKKITAWQLLQETGACDTGLDKLSTEDLFRIDKEIFEIGKKNGFLLSKRHHYLNCSECHGILILKSFQTTTTILKMNCNGDRM